MFYTPILSWKYIYTEADVQLLEIQILDEKERSTNWTKKELYGGGSSTLHSQNLAPST